MYKLEIHRQAAKYYTRLEPKIQSKINAAMKAIIGNPMEGLHIKKLKGALEGNYRYDVGSFRIIYQVDVQENIISVSAIGPRGDIYK